MTSALALTFALALVSQERERQEQWKRNGRFMHTCADSGMNDYEKLAVLVEEVGEVAREVLTGGDTIGTCVALREELIQVAAVAVAWVEALL